MSKLTDTARAWRWVRRVFPNTFKRAHSLDVNAYRLAEALALAYAAGLKAGRREVNP